MLGLIDDTDTSILNNTTTVVLAKKFTPTLNISTSFTIHLNNKFYNPHSGHNATAGGIIASTGFYLGGVTSTEYFFDDDGNGNLRVYYLVSGVRTYFDAAAGTVDYTNGIIKINSLTMTGVGDVDNVSSTQIRITAIPDSYDIVPVRNQILEIDLVNTTVTASVDATATSGVGYTTTQTATGSTTTVSTATSSSTSSGY